MAAAPPSVIVKFVLYEKERNIDVQRESDLFCDIIFVHGGTTTDYRSIVYKTFAFIQVSIVCKQMRCIHICVAALQGHSSRAGLTPRAVDVTHRMNLSLLMQCVVTQPQS